MTPTREEAERLKRALTASLCPNKLEQQIAEFIDRQAAEIERLQGSEIGLDRYSVKVNAENAKLRAEIERLNSDRRVLQADGKHPAPCARHCEANAFNIELSRAKKTIERKDALLREALNALEASQRYVEASANARLEIGWGDQLDKAEIAIANIKTELGEPT